MVQTRDGVKNNEWITFMRACLAQYKQQKSRLLSCVSPPPQLLWSMTPPLPPPPPASVLAHDPRLKRQRGSRKPTTDLADVPLQLAFEFPSAWPLARLPGESVPPVTTPRVERVGRVECRAVPERVQEHFAR